MKKLLFTLGLFVLGTSLTAPQAQSAKQGFPWQSGKPPREPVYPEILVDAQWLDARSQDSQLRIVDVRSVNAYHKGHLPGAVRLESLESMFEAAALDAPDRLAAMLGSQGISGREAIVLYGDELSHGELGRIFWLLEWAGCPMPRILDGGVTAWSMNGGSLSDTKPVLAELEFRAETRDSLRIDASWIAERYGETELCEIIDLRDERKWFRYEAPAGDAPGHIPFSLPYDFRSLLPEAGGWPDAAQARASFALLGPRERDYVDLDSVFALMGEDAADPRPYLGYLLLRMMDVRARVYCEGWRAWAGRDELPRVRIIDAAALEAMIAAENPRFDDRPPESFALLDLRGERDWILRHLPGALSMPAHLLSDSLETLIAERWPDRERSELPLIFYCYGPDCTRSRIGASKAARMGFRQLIIFRDGVAEWTEAGMKDYGRPLPPSRMPRPPKKKEKDPRRR